MKILPFAFFAPPELIPQRESPTENPPAPFPVSPWNSVSFPEIWGGHNFRIPVLPKIFTNLPRLSSAPKTASPPETIALKDWLEVLPAFGDALMRADLDFYDLPLNRNVVGNPQASVGLKRASEYNPKHGKHPGLTVTVPRSTFGRGHAEIRPIRGSQDSLITRVTLDFQGANTFFKLPGNKGYLEIDCFTGVTTPTMTYDPEFTQRQESVTSVGKDGNNKYENACIDKNGLATPFDSVAEPPPKTDEGTNPDWMFYFQPVRKSLWSRIASNYINRNIGGLWLWANNPTFGFVDSDYFDDFEIRYNTWPRKFGELLQFFSPLFDKKTREELKQKAPYLNPNTEYLDENNLRQAIPDELAKLDRLNARRKKLGMEPVPRKRGTIVDWVFTDLMGDPRRMAATPVDRFPSIGFHAQFKPGTVLNLPIGKVQINPATDMKVRYGIIPVPLGRKGKDGVRARAELKVTLGPLHLSATDFKIAGYKFRVDGELYARFLEVSIPLDQVFPEGEEGWKLNPDWENLRIKIKGLRANDLELTDPKLGITLNLGKFHLAEFNHTPEKGKILANLIGLKAGSLTLAHEMGSLSIAQAHLPELQMETASDLSQVKAHVPKIESRGEIQLNPNYGSKSHITLEGTQQLSKIRFSRKEKNGDAVSHLRFQLAGEVETVDLENEEWGKAVLNLKEQGKTHRLSGAFTSHIRAPMNPESGRGRIQYQFRLNIPYTGFELDSPVVKMPAGMSSLRNGTIRVSPGMLSLEGDLNLAASEVKGVGTDIFQWKDFKMTPHLEDVRVSGSAVFEYSQNGFRLARRSDGDQPLNIQFRLTESTLTHTPFDEAHLRKHPSHRVIKTGVRIDEARVVAQNLQEVEYRTTEVSGEKLGQLARLESGPILIHQLKGGGDIWVNTFLWSWLRGYFPYFGFPLRDVPTEFQDKKPKGVKKPDVEKLIGHLEKEDRSLLWDPATRDYGNFVRIGGISIGPGPSGRRGTHTQILDLNLYAHSPGYNQFMLVGIPEINFTQKYDSVGKLNFDVDMGKEKIYTHVRVVDKLRGYNPFELLPVGNRPYGPPQIKKATRPQPSQPKLPFELLGPEGIISVSPWFLAH